MKRQPLEALGLTPEQIGAVLNMHHADMDKARAEHFRTHKATETRGGNRTHVAVPALVQEPAHGAGRGKQRLSG